MLLTLIGAIQAEENSPKTQQQFKILQIIYSQVKLQSPVDYKHFMFQDKWEKKC